MHEPRQQISSHLAGVLLTLPYLACHAKKYSKAPSGCPTKQKLIQNTEFPIMRVDILFIRSRGRVAAMSGSWNIIPANATPAGRQSKKNSGGWDSNIPMRLCVGMPTRSSCRIAEKRNTMKLAENGLQPRPTNGE